MASNDVSSKPSWVSVLPGALGLLASAMGAFFAGFSTHDYAQHLDRRLHVPHCSFVPGIAEPATGENACSAAMYSPYSALLRDRLWGGVPIALFGLGAFAFFFAASLYLLLGRNTASKRLRLGFFAAALGPAGASIVMLVISLTRLDALCKLCVGIYIASLLLLVASFLGLRAPRPTSAPPPKAVDVDATSLDPEPWHLRANRTVNPTVVDKTAPAAGVSSTIPDGSWGRAIGFVLLFGAASLVPVGVYAAAVPGYSEKVRSCGSIEVPATKAEDERPTLLSVETRNPKTPALSIEDPLCPSCQAFHERMTKEGLYDTLDMRVLLFPMDSECNWMLARPRHPGACIVSRAALCAEKTKQARALLDWVYENQKTLTDAGKEDTALLRKKVVAKFPDLDECIDSKETKDRLDRILQLAVKMKIRTSTPQLFIQGQKLCPEDTDLGLQYAMRILASKKGGSQ
ncbi:MAG: vitamin K epoxide reductase family protein [Polyangiaceae bacterium]